MKSFVTNLLWVCTGSIVIVVTICAVAVFGLTSYREMMRGYPEPVVAIEGLEPSASIHPPGAQRVKTDRLISFALRNDGAVKILAAEDLNGMSMTAVADALNAEDVHDLLHAHLMASKSEEPAKPEDTE